MTILAQIVDPAPRASAFLRPAFRINADVATSQAATMMRRAFVDGGYREPEDLTFEFPEDEVQFLGAALSAYRSMPCPECISLSDDLRMLWFPDSTMLLARRSALGSSFIVQPWVLQSSTILRLADREWPAVLIDPLLLQKKGPTAYEDYCQTSLTIRLRREQKAQTALTDLSSDNDTGISSEMKSKLLRALCEEAEAWMAYLDAGNAELLRGKWPAFLCTMQPHCSAEDRRRLEDALALTALTASIRLEHPAPIFASAVGGSCWQHPGRRGPEIFGGYCVDTRIRLPRPSHSDPDPVVGEISSCILEALNIDLAGFFTAVPPRLNGNGQDLTDFDMPSIIREDIAGQTHDEISSHQILETIAELSKLGLSHLIQNK